MKCFKEAYKNIFHCYNEHGWHENSFYISNMHWIHFIPNQSFMNILHGYKLVRLFYVWRFSYQNGFCYGCLCIRHVVVIVWYEVLSTSYGHVPDHTLSLSLSLSLFLSRATSQTVWTRSISIEPHRLCTGRSSTWHNWEFTTCIRGNGCAYTV